MSTFVNLSGSVPTPDSSIPPALESKITSGDSLPRNVEPGKQPKQAIPAITDQGQCGSFSISPHLGVEQKSSPTLGLDKCGLILDSNQCPDITLPNRALTVSQRK